MPAKRTKKEIETRILEELSNEDLSWTELMKRTDTAPPVLSSHLKRLESEDKVSYIADSNDRRQGKYCLTDLSFRKAAVLGEWFEDYFEAFLKTVYKVERMEDLREMEKEEIRTFYHAIAGAYSEYLFFLLNNKEKIGEEFQFIIKGLFESAEKFIDEFIGVFGELPNIPIRGNVVEKIFYCNTMDEVKEVEKTLCK